MARVTVIRSVQASSDVVFRTVADARQIARALSGVVKVELLSEMTSGVGARFRQSRMMSGRETTMDFEVTEYVDNQRIRIVNETQGTIWDSLFTVESWNRRSTLTMSMEARAKRLFPRLLMPMICLLIRKAVAKDIDAVKTFCEMQEDG